MRHELPVYCVIKSASSFGYSKYQLYFYKIDAGRWVYIGKGNKKTSRLACINMAQYRQDNEENFFFLPDIEPFPGRKVKPEELARLALKRMKQ